MDAKVTVYKAPVRAEVMDENFTSKGYNRSTIRGRFYPFYFLWKVGLVYEKWFVIELQT